MKKKIFRLYKVIKGKKYIPKMAKNYNFVSTFVFVKVKANYIYIPQFYGNRTQFSPKITITGLLIPLVTISIENR